MGVGGNGYPLSGVRESRALGRDEAQAELGAARERVAEAERAVQAARAALSVAREQTRRGARRTGAVSGAELARAGARAAAESVELAALSGRLKDAEAALQVQARALRLAELRLEAAVVEHAVVERHHERWATQVRKDQARREDDEADDVHAARRALRGK